MKTRIGPPTLKRISCMLLSALLMFSLLPAPALAEIAEGLSAQAVSNNFYPEASKTYEFNSGLPSESNVRKDIYVRAKYSDEYLSQSSWVYNDDLAYASACLAAAADNSNEWGENYYMKSRNVTSYLSSIGCSQVRINDGYRSKPMKRANIGVAIGFKDVQPNSGKPFRLFVFGIRGGGYEEEWAPNMRVGETGDAQGFQEARDGALGFIMSYIQEFTASLDADTDIKVWGSGYCRGGTTTNLVFGWLNKWVYERNNGCLYNGLDYTQSYNSEHSFYGANYSADEGKYTEKVYFDTNSINSHAKFSNEGLFAYPVNCPFGADATDVDNYENLMKGIHNLINPDDWFPQLIMDWFGFKRYGYTQDHDITGTYATDGTLHVRDKSVWEATSSHGPDTAVRNLNQTRANILAIDSNTVFSPTPFRQYYFSKYGAFERGVRNVSEFMSRIFLPWSKKKAYQTVVKLDFDTAGEGNQYYSKGKELYWNQGAYYQEFMRFLLVAGGFKNSDSAEDKAFNRKHYVDNYQNAFYNVCKWVLGAPLEARERFGKVSSDKAISAAKELVIPDATDMFIGAATSVGFVPIKYIINIIRAVNDDEATKVSEFIGKVLRTSMKDLNIAYVDADVSTTSSALGKLALAFYNAEQKIGKLNFYHALTIMKGCTSIAQSHWPEQSLAWFTQFSAASLNPYDKKVIKAQSEPGARLLAMDEDDTPTLADNEHQIVYYDPIDGAYYDAGIIEDDDYIASIALAEELGDEGYDVTNWQMYDLAEYDDEDDEKGCFGSFFTAGDSEEGGYRLITADDPQYILLIPEYSEAASRHVKMWLNKDATGFDQDVLIAEFDVYEGGYQYIAHTKPELDFEDDESITYYGDNEALLKRTGVELIGWVNEEGTEEEPTMYMPDDYVNYEDFTDDDVDNGAINLYAIWFDPLAYGVSYHSNLTLDDNGMVEDYQLASENDTLDIQSPSELGLSSTNAGKRFAGWNTKADGTGTRIAAGDASTIAQLGLGDRETYLSEIKTLGQKRADSYTYDAQDNEILDPTKDAEADAYEDELVSKYTVHLYAMWDASGSGNGGSGTSENSDTSDATQTGSIQMWRLYNPNSGEHFYTASTGERDQVVAAGWVSEGKAWVAPATSAAPVYRLYNPNGGDHHYTLSAGERDLLVAAGWRYEGIGWYSDVDKTVPVYRQYNPNANMGSHNFTVSAGERDLLVAAGWHDEGIGWYALAG